MSEMYKPKTGETVRVVLQGKAIAQPDGSFQLGRSGAHNYIYPDREHVVSVEKVRDPLPTTSGSAVVFAESRELGTPKRAWLLDDFGEWRSPSGVALPHERAEEYADMYGIEHVWDAGSGASS